MNRNFINKKNILRKAPAQSIKIVETPKEDKPKITAQNLNTFNKKTDEKDKPVIEEYPERLSKATKADVLNAIHNELTKNLQNIKPKLQKGGMLKRLV